MKSLSQHITESLLNEDYFSDANDYYVLVLNKPNANDAKKVVNNVIPGMRGKAEGKYIKSHGIIVIATDLSLENVKNDLSGVLRMSNFSLEDEKRDKEYFKKLKIDL